MGAAGSVILHFPTPYLSHFSLMYVMANLRGETLLRPAQQT